jgi:hypothetical protein
LVEVFGIISSLRLDNPAAALKVADAPLYCVSIVTPALLFQESGLFIVQGPA